MSVRGEKIASLIKEELSMLFLYKLQDPALGLVTITSVKMTPDLNIAKIYLSAYEKDQRSVILQKVENIRGMIRSHIASRIKLRYTPEMHFYIDETLDYVEKMEDLFKKIHKDDNKDDSTEQD